MVAVDQGLQVQTPGQWAVRWFAVVGVALLCVSVPLHHFYWHVLLGRKEAAVPLRSQRGSPPVTLNGVMSGRWADQKAKSLQEDSPIVWWLRGNWNEARYHAGVMTSARLHFGKEEWLFGAATVRPRSAAFVRLAGVRQARLVQVRDFLREKGVALLVAVIPNKVRIYPSQAFDDGVLPRELAGEYQEFLDELSDLQIPAVDLAVPMRAAAAGLVGQDDEFQLYYRRDTHWRPGGALVAARAIAASIETKFGDLLSDRLPTALNGPSSRRTVGDLTSSLGMLSYVRAGQDGKRYSVALSMLTDELAEERQYYGVDVVTAERRIPVLGDDDSAEIVHVGTSFALDNGRVAISYALGRPTRAFITPGASGILPLRDALAAIQAGLRPKLVLWEIVERGSVEQIWKEPLRIGHH